MMDIMGRLFKQTLALVYQNRALNYLEFSWIFNLNIYFCEQSKGSQKLAVEGHVFNGNNPLGEDT